MSKNYGDVMGDMQSGHCEAHSESSKLQVLSSSKPIKTHPNLSPQITGQLLVLPTTKFFTAT
jgi:hypothetical protein